MTPTGYALAILTGIVALLLLLFVVAVFRLVRRTTGRQRREAGVERVFVADAMQDALHKLKAQEQAMTARAHASEHLSEQIVASLTAGLLVVDAGGSVQILNPAGRRLLGAGAEGDLPRGYRDVLAATPPLAEAIDQCMTSGRPIVRRALRIDRPDRTVHLGVTVSPFGGDGARRGVICRVSDLTAVVELEDQLRLKATLAQLGELTAGLAHEFRNGLATIHGYARLMDPKAVPTAYEPYVEGIRQETDSLQKVVTNFLNFARPHQVAFSPVDLHEVLQRASEDVMPRGGGHRCRLEVQGRFATVPGDDVLRLGEVILGEHVAMVVRHHRLLGASRPNLTPADDDRNVDLLARHRLQPRLELGPLGRAGQIAAVRIVHGLRNAAHAGERRLRGGRLRPRGRLAGCGRGGALGVGG